MIRRREFLLNSRLATGSLLAVGKAANAASRSSVSWRTQVAEWEKRFPQLMTEFMMAPRLVRIEMGSVPDAFTVGLMDAVLGRFGGFLWARRNACGFDCRSIGSSTTPLEPIMKRPDAR
jgi:hypothetical protein